jgi:hypothetical protein
MGPVIDILARSRTLATQVERGRRAAANKGEARRGSPATFQLLYVDVQPYVLGALPLRVVVYDEAGDVAMDYRTQMDSVSLCPRRLEKAR